MAAKKKIVPPKKVLNKRYERGGVIGSGGFGVIYKGYDTKEKRDVAIKTECLYSGHNQLPKEYALYKKIGKAEGFLEAYDYFSEGSQQYLVFTLVGDSLEKVMQNNGKRIDLKSTLMIAIQLIRHIQSLHEKHYLHRDIKPDNMAFGIGNGASTLFILDLGLGKEYIRHGRHTPMNDAKNLIGTARYASLNSHEGLELSRRDDLESIAYVLIYLLKGSLPWQGLHSDYHVNKYEKVRCIKKRTSTTELCHGLEPEFREFLKYTRQLGYEQQPDYKRCIALFQRCMTRKKFVHDDIYPWTKDTDPAAVKIRKAKEAEEERIRRAQLLARRRKLHRKFRFPASTVDKFFSDNCGLTLEQKQAIVRKNMLEGAAFPTLAPPMFPPRQEDIDAGDNDIVPLVEFDVKVTEAPQSPPIKVLAITNDVEEKEEGEITEMSISADDQEVSEITENDECCLQGQARSAIDSVVPRGTNVMIDYNDKNSNQDQTTTISQSESQVNDGADAPLCTAAVIADVVEENKLEEAVLAEDSPIVDAPVIEDENIDEAPLIRNVPLIDAPAIEDKKMDEAATVHDDPIIDVPATEEQNNDQVTPAEVVLTIDAPVIEEEKMDEAAPAKDVPTTTNAATVVEEKKTEDKAPACAVKATAKAGSDNSGKKKKKKKRKAAAAVGREDSNAPRKKTSKQIQAEKAAMVAAQARQELEARVKLEAEQKKLERQRQIFYHSYLQPNHHLPPPENYISYHGNNHYQLPAVPSQYNSYQARNTYNQVAPYNSNQIMPYNSNQVATFQPNQLINYNAYQKRGGPVLPKFQQRQAPYMNQPRTTFNPQFGVPGQQQLVHRNTSIDGAFLF